MCLAKDNCQVIHISISDNCGGSSLAGLRLHSAMLSAGIDSKYLVYDKLIADRNDIIQITKNRFVKYFRAIIKRIFERAIYLVSGKLNNQRGCFYFCCGYDDILKHDDLKKCDVIYFHGVLDECINYKSLRKILALNKKTYWFLHDCFSFTGGCAHPFECEKYTSECRNCPYWGGFSLFDCAQNEYRQKYKIIGRVNNLAFIAPSSWMLGVAKKSAIVKNKAVHHIPNMVNPRNFKIIDKTVARSLFSIDSAKKIIGFGAASATTNPYKGWEYMKNALNILAKKSNSPQDIEILIFGCNYQKEIADSLPFKTHFLGFLQDEYSAAMAYNAMDVFVVSSLAENFPQTIIESLACNAPVVAFDVGGIPNIVNGKTGYLAKYKDCDDLAHGINLILSEKEKLNVRQYVEKYFPEPILQKHFEIWKTT